MPKKLKKVQVSNTTVYCLLALAIVIFFVLLRLGFWQLDRYQQKLDLQYKLSSKDNGYIEFNADIINKNDKSLLLENFLLSGKVYGKKTILLDNSCNNSICGYKVINILKIENSDKHILVDRGWIKSPSKNRKILPKLEPLSGKVEFKGKFRKIFDNKFSKADVEDFSDILRVQKINVEQLEKILKLRLFENIFSINNNSDNKFTIIETGSWLTPENHCIA